jgi:hypothetical protein
VRPDDLPPRPDLNDGVPRTTTDLRPAGPVYFTVKLAIAAGIALAICVCVVFALDIVGFGFMEPSSHGGRGFVWNVHAVRLFEVLLPVTAIAIGSVCAFWRGSTRARFPLLVSLVVVLVMVLVLLFATGRFADCNVTRCGWVW